MADGNVLYLDLAESMDGAILRGGALVVDPTTEPLEFRCTDAVRPTKLQKVLWGSRLDGHIAANLLGEPLIRSLKQTFSLVVVMQSDFMELRSKLEVPVVQLMRHAAIEFPDSENQGDSSKMGDSADDDPEMADRILINPSGKFEQVILRPHDDHRADLETARGLLQPLFMKRDVMEPFERIATALELVHERDQDERSG